MRLTMEEGTDPARVRHELGTACAAFAPNAYGALLDPEAVWRALLAGILEDRMVAAEWGPLPERRRAWRGDEERRLAFDAAAVASATCGPWWVMPYGLAA